MSCMNSLQRQEYGNHRPSSLADIMIDSGRCKRIKKFVIKNYRRFLAEIIGTYILVLIHAGSAIETNWVLDTTRMTFIGQVLATGLSLTFLIYAFGDISGAHFNPNVSLAFFLRREFPLVLLILYFMSQFIGGYLAAATLFGLFGTSVDHMGANDASGVPLIIKAWIIELICTAILILVILRVVNRGSAIEKEAAIAVGSTILVLTCFGGNFGVGSMNLIRTLSIATFSDMLNVAGIIISAQLTGVCIASLLSRILDIPVEEEQLNIVQGRVESSGLEV